MRGTGGPDVRRGRRRLSPRAAGRGVALGAIGLALVGLLAGPARAPAGPSPAGAQEAGTDLGFDPSPWQERNVEYDGRFTFVRLMFRPLSTGFGRRPDLKWDHDYPVAERNFGRLLDELTGIEPHPGGSNVLAMDDPELFRYPVAYLSEPGFWTLSEAEEENLRAYLLKGGFLILDDFAGPRQWDRTTEVLGRLLPDHRLVPLDETHPIFDSFFHIERIEMPHPNFPVVASYYGIFEENDPTGRMMVIVNRDNDIGDYWEWSDRGWVPIELSNEAYKLGVNYVIYALTH